MLSSDLRSQAQPRQQLLYSCVVAQLQGWGTLLAKIRVSWQIRAGVGV